MLIETYINGSSVEAAETGVILHHGWRIVFGSADVFPLIALKKVSRGNWSEIVSCRVLQAERFFAGKRKSFGGRVS